MRASRAPWWLYIISASFLGYFALQVYIYIWGPESLGFESEYRSGSMIVRKVSPQGAGARAGLRAGDRIVEVDGIPIRGDKGNFDLGRAGANFEPGHEIPIKIEREGKQIELTASLQRGSLRDLDWRDWQLLGGEIFTLILA